jgi:hypothetical protein
MALTAASTILPLDSLTRTWSPTLCLGMVAALLQAKASQPCAALFYALFHLCPYSLKQHPRRQVCKVSLHPVCPFEEFGGDGLSVSGLEPV